MSARDRDGKPLEELKHEPVPGYLSAFLVVSGLMGIYLAVVMVSSPGMASYKGDKKGAAKELPERVEEQ